MKIGNPFKQSEDFYLSQDKQVRELIDGDLYWYIDTFTWTSCRTSIWFLHNAIIARYENR